MERTTETYITNRHGKEVEIHKPSGSTPIMKKEELYKIKDALTNGLTNKSGNITLKAPHEKYYILWSLSLGLGFRISDTLKLTVKDVTSSNAEITEQKTGKRRMITVPTGLQPVLNTYIEKYNLKDNDKLIFANRKNGAKNKAIDKSQAYRKLREIVEAVCPDVQFSNHTTRKTWAYFLYLKEDKNIAIVQKALNHTSSLTTCDYIGLSKKELKETLIKYDPMSGEW